MIAKGENFCDDHGQNFKSIQNVFKRLIKEQKITKTTLAKIDARLVRKNINRICDEVNMRIFAFNEQYHNIMVT